jgi:YcaO-like protein with predicted kinase domain
MPCASAGRARERPDGRPGPGVRRDPGIKAYRDGTHRTTSPASTIERLLPLMASMGITRIANVTGLDRIGVPVVMVVRPNARSIAVSQGKGLDLDAARASGLMEAAEIWHAERIDLPLRLCSYEELSRTQPVVDVLALPRVEDGCFGPALRLLWIEGRDLLSNRTLWLPYEMVHVDFTLPLPSGSGCFPASSNGLASGNHLLEAIVHGICEVIERDATTLWHRLDMPARASTRMDLRTVEDEACREVVGRLEQAGFAVAAFETTTDVGVPAFCCAILDEGRPQAHGGIGAGCHPARAIALLRALCEAVQVRMTYISGSRDDLEAKEYQRATMAQRLRGLRALMRTGDGGRAFAEVPDRDFPSLADDLDWLLERLSAVGVREVAIVDLTRPEMGLPVVRVVIPGLEAPDDVAGFVPGQRARALREGVR